MKRVLDKDWLERTRQDAMHALASGDLKTKAGRFNPTAETKPTPKTVPAE